MKTRYLYVTAWCVLIALTFPPSWITWALLTAATSLSLGLLDIHGLLPKFERPHTPSELMTPARLQWLSGEEPRDLSCELYEDVDLELIKEEQRRHKHNLSRAKTHRQRLAESSLGGLLAFLFSSALTSMTALITALQFSQHNGDGLSDSVIYGVLWAFVTCALIVPTLFLSIFPLERAIMWSRLKWRRSKAERSAKRIFVMSVELARERGMLSAPCLAEAGGLSEHRER